MAIKFEIFYHEHVITKDIPRISKIWRGKIKKAIEKKLVTKPEIFGKPLRKSLKGYRRLRTGDYRIIFRIEQNVVKILAIQHRSKIYNIINKRI